MVGWLKIYEKNMDGWMDKKIDGWWMDGQKKRCMVGWIE